MDKKKIGREAGRVLLQGLVLVIRALPLPAGLALGRALGNLMRRLSKKRYRVALKNLRIAYGDTMLQAERERIARECFRQFGMYLVEFIKFAYMSDEALGRLFDVDPAGEAEFRQLMERKQGLLFILSHLGTFENMHRWLTSRGFEVIGIVREARDQGTTRMMNELRERDGMRVISLKQSLKPVLVGLKKNACIAIVCDQNAADVFVPFFGHRTGTADGPARIALKMRTPMLFPYAIRDGKGRYFIKTNGHYDAESTGNEEADIARVMTEVNRRLEETIRAHPEQWLWFHDRWKASPDVRPEAGA